MRRIHFSTAMHAGVAHCAKCNEVFFRVVATVAAEFFVVNFKVRHSAAGLASPTIAVQYLVTKFFVQSGIKPQAWAFWLGPVHDAFPVK